MSTIERVVIVGAGLAGAKIAEALRDKGFVGSITLVGDESERPYERPPLSKGYLSGQAERDSVFVHGEGWYAEHDVVLLLGTAVTAIDRAAHRVTLDDGNTLPYDALVIATGASPRTLPIPSADHAGVHYLRRLDDSDDLKRAISQAQRIAIVGAGWIGLEVAAAARQGGVGVTVLEYAELPLLGVLGPEVAEVFANLHREHGVDLRLGVEVAEIVVTDDRPAGIRLADGTVIGADAVVVAVGAKPNTELAEAAGLMVDDGVVVDEGLRTADAAIYAVGDVANQWHPLLGRRIRVEHWANALNQPDVAAASIMGEDVAFDLLPFFYTDQYDLGMEYHGRAGAGGYDDVVFRGDKAGREFIAFWRKDGRVIAGMNVNIWDVDEPIKALIRSGAVVAADELANTDMSLEDLAGR
ncbi:MAG: FAD-dependent oxidoreductase [Pseudonocardiales bacterium]|nr:MAG: FAD-dependent oxidoreductase [Pseudonocardiales bacterium]